MRGQTDSVPHRHTHAPTNIKRQTHCLNWGPPGEALQNLAVATVCDNTRMKSIYRGKREGAFLLLIKPYFYKLIFIWQGKIVKFGLGWWPSGEPGDGHHHHHHHHHHHRPRRPCNLLQTRGSSLSVQIAWICLDEWWRWKLKRLYREIGTRQPVFLCMAQTPWVKRSSTTLYFGAHCWNHGRCIILISRYCFRTHKGHWQRVRDWCGQHAEIQKACSCCRVLSRGGEKRLRVSAMCSCAACESCQPCAISWCWAGVRCPGPLACVMTRVSRSPCSHFSTGTGDLKNALNCRSITINEFDRTIEQSYCVSPLRAAHAFVI